MSTEKMCFVIGPIGDEDSDIRERANLTFEYIIKPIVEEFGYSLTRADHINESGMITSQIIDQIVDSSLVIADLSDNNPNVFYELAIRHIVQKPYIHMIKSGQDIPFDITGMRAIYFNVDLESAHKAKEDLHNQIKSIENNQFKPNNPITSAITQKNISKMLSEEGNIESDNIPKVVLESVSELRSMIIDVKNEIYHLKSPQISTKKRVFVINTEINELDELISELRDEISSRSMLYDKVTYDKEGHETINQKDLKLIDEIQNLKSRLDRLIERRKNLIYTLNHPTRQKYLDD